MFAEGQIERFPLLPAPSCSISLLHLLRTGYINNLIVCERNHDTFTVPCLMFSISAILSCMLLMSKCIAQENPLFSTTDSYDPFVFSDFSPFTDPENPGETLQTDLLDPTDPTLAFLNDDQKDSLSIFADSNDSCDFETSQLADTLSRRGARSECQNPDTGNSGLNVPTINPKVAPFVDIQTMELKTTCPSQDKTPYSVAVCSSGITGDIVAYPPNLSDFDLFWAQKGKYCLRSHVRSL